MAGISSIAIRMTGTVFLFIGILFSVSVVISLLSEPISTFSFSPLIVGGTFIFLGLRMRGKKRKHIKAEIPIRNHEKNRDHFIPCGHYYRSDWKLNPKERASYKEAKEWISELKVTDYDSSNLEMDYSKAMEFFRKRMPPDSDPANFGPAKSAGGIVDYETVVDALASVMFYVCHGFYDEYREKSITSDGTVIRWQDEYMYQDIEDRAQPYGLYQFEIKRISEDKYWIQLNEVRTPMN